MIKHIVMWKLKKGMKESTLPVVKQMFESLLGEVDGLISVEVAGNCVPDESACDLVLVAVFADKAALHAYQNHPGHVLIKEYLGPKRESRHQVDCEIESH